MGRVKGDHHDVYVPTSGILRSTALWTRLGRFNGKQRTNISVDFNNPSKFGDQLSFQKIVNTSTNYDFSKISYEFPILHSGLKSKLTYSDLEFEIGN